jgi:hypothetical protein
LGVKLTRCIDFPDIPGHRYYEGYLHGATTSRPLESLNPRLGFKMTKLPAPVALRALCEAVRRRLAPALLEALRRDKSGDTPVITPTTASDNAASNDASPNPMVALVASLIEQGLCFSDLAVQVHAGDGVPASSVGWHTDAPNSVVHMALSLGPGSRALHSMRSSQPKGDPERRVAWQRTGDVYVSSPACFEHGVEYEPARLWRHRVIAVQARFPIGLDRDLLQLHSGSHFTDLMTRLAEGFEAGGAVGMPTLVEVEAIEAELRGLEER